MESIKLPPSGYALETIHDGERLLLSEALTEDVIRALAAKHKIVEIWAWWRNDAGDVALLQRFDDLRRLHVLNRTQKSLERLNKLANLNVLTIDSDRPVDVDVAAWPRLRELAFEWRGNFTNLGCADDLEVLRVGKWKDRDCELISAAGSLKALEIVGGAARSLSGIEKCVSLRTLTLINLTRLEDFSALGLCRQLQTLRIDTCKKLHNLDVISSLANLEALYLDNLGDIASLTPLTANKKLKVLQFIESTNILDGNTEIVRQIGLERYAFQNRKHYNFNYDHLVAR